MLLRSRLIVRRRHYAINEDIDRAFNEAVRSSIERFKVESVKFKKVSKSLLLEKYEIYYKMLNIPKSDNKLIVTWYLAITYFDILLLRHCLVNLNEEEVWDALYIVEFFLETRSRQISGANLLESLTINQL